MGNACLNPSASGNIVGPSSTGRYIATPLTLEGSSENNNDLDEVNKNFTKYKRKGGKYVLTNVVDEAPVNKSQQVNMNNSNLTPLSNSPTLAAGRPRLSEPSDTESVKNSSIKLKRTPRVERSSAERFRVNNKPVNGKDSIKVLPKQAEVTEHPEGQGANKVATNRSGKSQGSKVAQNESTDDVSKVTSSTPKPDMRVGTVSSKAIKTRPNKPPDDIKVDDGEMMRPAKQEAKNPRGGGIAKPQEHQESNSRKRTKNKPTYSLKQMRHAFYYDFQTFLLNNTLMSVQFGPERELLSRARLTFRPSVAPGAASGGMYGSGIDTRQNEMCSRLMATGHHKRAICPDAIHENLASIVRFGPPNTPGQGTQLRPIRVFICHEDVEVADQEHVYSDALKLQSAEQPPLTQVGIEQSRQPGFVRLRNNNSKVITPARTSMTGSYAEIEDDYSRFSDLNPSNSSCGGRRDDDLSSSQSEEEGQVEPTCTEFSHADETSKRFHKPLLPPTEGIRRSKSAPNIDDGETEDVLKDKLYSGNDFRTITSTERRFSGVVAHHHRSKHQRKGNRMMVPMNTNNPQAGSNSSNDSSGYKSVTGSTYTNVAGSHRSGDSTTSDSEYGYTTIASLNTPETLTERCKRIGDTGEPLKIGLPASCFTSVTFRFLSEDETDTNLFETREYLGSQSFMDNFSNVFAELLAKDLGFAPNAINNATVCGATITCQTTALKLDIIPSVNCPNPNWPEKAVEWLIRRRPQAFDQRTQKIYTWPTRDMIYSARYGGYHLIPVGHAPRRGGNSQRHLEWKIEFPEAEKYLESCLKHSQLRCYVFCLILFHSFFNTPDSVTENHLRHIIFWQAERLTLTWANFEMYNNIRAVLEYLYTALSKKTLPNYFLRKRNEFESIPTGPLHVVQRKVHLYRQNPLGHIIAALKNTQIVKNQYPTLDYNALIRLIKTPLDIDILNPTLRKFTVQQEVPNKKKASDTESEGFWSDMKRDPERNWNERYHKRVKEERKQKLLAEEKAQTAAKAEESNNSVKIEINASKFYLSQIRRNLFLELFIDHFIKLIQTSVQMKLKSQAGEYLAHTENLFVLLEENGGAKEEKKLDIRQTLDSLAEQIESSLPLMQPSVINQKLQQFSKDSRYSEIDQTNVSRMETVADIENWRLQRVYSDNSDGTSTDHDSFVFTQSKIMMRNAPPSMLFLKRSRSQDSDSGSTEL